MGKCSHHNRAMKLGMPALACLVALATVIALWAPAHAAEKVVAPIGKIAAEYKGKFVTVQGVILSERCFKSGMRYLIGDDTGKITLVLFDRQLKQSPGPDRLIEGATVNVTGKVDVFRKELQIVPVRGTDVLIVEPAPPVHSPAIGALTQADVDRVVALQGTVTEAANFSAGFKFRMADDTGQITVTVFENVFDSLAKPQQLNVGATLSVTGKVDIFGNELQVVPASASRIRIVAPPAREAGLHALAQIGSNDQNAIVRVAGEVASVESFAHGSNVLLRDETGAQWLRLYQVVAKRVKLKAGDRIEAIGRVKVSKNKGIAIEVAVPADIQVKR